MSPEERIARLEARLAREQATRAEAERLAEEATRELYVTREQVRLISRVAVAANETDDLEVALVAAMEAVCGHAGWPAARAELLGEDGVPYSRVRHGELLPGSSRVFELAVRDHTGLVAARLEFFSPVPTPADGVLLEVVANVGRQLERVVDRVRAKHALRGALAELERSNAELENFAYAASHDLREPLRTIGGFAGLLSRRYEGRLGAEGDAFLEYIQDGVLRLQTLVDDLLALSRAGQGEKPRDRVDLAEVAAQTLQVLQPAIAEAEALVEIGRLPVVTGDAGQLGQVLANLVGNALKFRGAQAPRVKVGAERTADGWLLAVTDDGPGVAREDAERIFDMFQRAAQPAQASPGSGLGLAICRRIVEHHGGRIWVEPGPRGRGARFCVLLADREPAATDFPSPPGAVAA